MDLKISTLYEEFTPEIISKWEEALKKNSDAEWNCNKLSEVLPFIKATTPRVGRIQSLFGLSLICLDQEYPDEEKIVRYGLEPLVKSDILSEAEINQIVEWYKQTIPTWNSNNSKRFEKTFSVSGIEYRLITDCYRGCRDLNLQVVK